QRRDPRAILGQEVGDAAADHSTPDDDHVRAATGRPHAAPPVRHATPSRRPAPPPRRGAHQPPPPPTSVSAQRHANRHVKPTVAWSQESPGANRYAERPTPTKIG